MSNLLPPSLAAYFVPPEDCIGEFGVLTGYSADYHFLNDALEKFTQNIKSQRAFEGSGAIALMLDQNHKQISSVDCPGLIHLATKAEVKNEFKLLHSKVGLLLFKNKKNEQQIVRLLVSTGNWTRETLEDSLDLIWSVDYDLTDADDFQVQTDIAKAYNFLNYTLGFFNCDLLASKRLNGKATPTTLRYEHFKHALAQVTPTKGLTSRFFDNRDKALITQLPNLIKTHGCDVKRNYLAIGSGFYEGGDIKNKVPKAITAIEKALGDAGLLTKRPEKDIYVNPSNCQSIANSLDIINDNAWSVRPAFDALYEGKNHQRSLHAKFIFSAKKNIESDECKRSWLYLGSGNLTSPGFLNKASLNGGNLEAGVLFSPEGFNWYGEEKPEYCISHKLPINWDDETILTDVNKLGSGDGMPENDNEFIAAPVSYFILNHIDETSCTLRPCERVMHKYQVWFSEDEACEVDSGMVHWPLSIPRQVKVTWFCNGKTLNAYVPVFDEFGRLAATVLPELEIEDAWGLLGTFPALPNDDSNDGQPQDGNGPIERAAKPDVDGTEYHINKMMMLVEHIAQKQTAIEQINWQQWCYRLEQTFCQMGKSTVIQYFQRININPLSPLWAKPFRPHFAEDTLSEDGRLYEELLNKIEDTLKLTNLLKLGG
jgi:hypothetical protein